MVRLPRNINPYVIFANNTGVGKTVFSSLLVRGALKQNKKVIYFKPIQTGFPEDSDKRHVESYNKNDNLIAVDAFNFKPPKSPHLVNQDNIKDEQVILKVNQVIEQQVKLINKEHTTLFIETAGGALSPTLAGNLQADFYRELRYPIILVGDSRLGGISTTLATYESLKLRGFDIAKILLFKDDNYLNDQYFKNYFDISVTAINYPPEMVNDSKQDEQNMMSYYNQHEATFKKINDELDQYYENRYKKLKEMRELAPTKLWWPFTQHKTVSSIGVIDSAYKDNFTMYENEQFKQKYDACASWWTQGLGHGNNKIGLEIAYANGRYGHLIYPENVYEPAYDLANKLLNGVGKDWANKVFYSDNGSTGIEIAIKMVLNYKFKNNHNKNDKLILIGLNGSYHGDTIGAMNIANPNIYNENVHWYEPKGFWLDIPQVKIKDNKVQIYLNWLNQQHDRSFNTINQLFEYEQRQNDKDELIKIYEDYIDQQYNLCIENNNLPAALIIEPIIMGAGGMIMVDPLFQKILINKMRKLGILIIYDEVFTGFYRLGKLSTIELLKVYPDVAIYSKALTGGNVPFCATLTTNQIFDSFLNDKKTECLLHGHSYSAYPIGCQAALKSIEQYETMYSKNDSKELVTTTKFDNELINKISQHPKVDGVIALGSLMAIYLKCEQNNYNSNLAKQLIHLIDDQLFARALGNVFYILASHITNEKVLKQFQKEILIKLDNLE